MAEVRSVCRILVCLLSADRIRASELWVSFPSFHEQVLNTGGHEKDMLSAGCPNEKMKLLDQNPLDYSAINM